MRALLHPRGLLWLTGGCFLTVLAAVVLLRTLPADDAARLALLQLGSPGVVQVMRLANRMGEWPFLLAGLVVLLVVFREARARWWCWIGLMAVTPLAEGALKFLVGRPRPEGVALGFPSGHATAAAAFFGAVIYLASALPATVCAAVRMLAPLAILLVGLARVILGAHWPSDVLGGIALGLAAACVAALLSTEDRGASRAPSS
jgi:undecaprenyl-diphosphatase